jgi:very-short-patch-repair endonuclease
MNTKRNEQATFDSIFEEEVYEKLTEKGYLIETQVGIGGYSIDLAIVDKITHEYILGIECDGKTYHSSPIAKERDYYRQKYLESRGWKIHRIWSSDWWHNPNREIQKISDLVTDYMKQNERKSQVKEKIVGYEYILNKLKRSNLEYTQFSESIMFHLDKEIIEVYKDNHMKSSYKDVRSLDLLAKEIDAFVMKKLSDKRQVIIKDLVDQEEDESTEIKKININQKEKSYELKEGEIRCMCSHVFFESLGECPKCGANTSTIIREQAKRNY